MKTKSDETTIKLNLKVFLDFLDPALWEKWQIDCGLTEFIFYTGIHKQLALPKTLMENEEVKSLFLEIICTDDWKTHAEINMLNHSVTNQYVESYVDKVHKLTDALCKTHQDELKLLVYYAVAIRFYIEKTELKLPLPTHKGTEEDAHKEYARLKDTQAQLLSLGSPIGKSAANFFMEDVRFECATKNKTYKVNWDTPLLIGKLVTWMKYHKSISNQTMTNLKNDNVVSSFRPAAVKYLVHYIHEKDKDVKISSYLNLCGGWGCRLVGALSTPEITRYIQTDPNPELLPISKQIYEAYDPQKQTEAHFYDKPMEDLTIDELCPNGKKNQLVFFSPPFFNKEKYKGELQSHKRYSKPESWLRDFLYKSLQVSYASLDNGILAINLADILYGRGVQLKLTDCLIHLLEVNMANYFTKFSEPLIYPTAGKAPPSYIYMYKTKPYHASLNTYPNFEMQTAWRVKKEDRPIKIKTTDSTKKEPKKATKPKIITSKPSINNTTLFELHKCIERLDTLEKVAEYYGCSSNDVERRIMDWGFTLSFEKLKYTYASSATEKPIKMYKNWQMIDNDLMIDYQPFDPNTLYLSYFNCNPYNPYGFMSDPTSDFVPLQIICSNPYNKIVSCTYLTPTRTLLNYPLLFNYLAEQGMIKQWVEIPNYYECIPKINNTFQQTDEDISITEIEIEEDTIEIKEILTEKEDFAMDIIKPSPGRSAFSLFNPQQGTKTTREPENEDVANKKICYGS